jgi:nucleoside-diphosphate-sugar epimerase
MYGCNKLYAEHLGKYYDRFYPRFKSVDGRPSIDFRALRFPGLISADTLPTGGTTDYGPEMLHHAAQGLPYTCFVRPDTCLPFMVMPDAIKALLELESAPAEQLTRHVYNVTSFNPTAQEIHAITIEAFPQADIEFVMDEGRQAIVDTWPKDTDDTAACEDWGWEPDFGMKEAFEDYLIPAIRRRYES